MQIALIRAHIGAVALDILTIGTDVGLVASDVAVAVMRYAVTRVVIPIELTLLVIVICVSARLLIVGSRRWRLIRVCGG
jgi:hypothetical protein